MFPFIVVAVAAAAGGALLGFSRARASSGPEPVGYIATPPVGYRRLEVGDKITASMVYAQQHDLGKPLGVHSSYDEGAFMTGVENPTGLKKQVVIFVPLGSEYLK